MLPKEGTPFYIKLFWMRKSLNIEMKNRFWGNKMGEQKIDWNLEVYVSKLL